MYIYIHIYTGVYIYICICVHIYTYICIYIYIYTCVYRILYSVLQYVVVCCGVLQRVADAVMCVAVGCRIVTHGLEL